jgi:hypothetical protein
MSTGRRRVGSRPTPGKERPKQRRAHAHTHARARSFAFFAERHVAHSFLWRMCWCVFVDGCPSVVALSGCVCVSTPGRSTHTCGRTATPIHSLATCPCRQSPRKLSSARPGRSKSCSPLTRRTDGSTCSPVVSGTRRTRPWLCYHLPCLVLPCLPLRLVPPCRATPPLSGGLAVHSLALRLAG